MICLFAIRTHILCATLCHSATHNTKHLFLKVLTHLEGKTADSSSKAHMAQASNSTPEASAGIAVEGQYLQELQEQKEELLSKVQALKTDLQDWRSKLESQVKTYKSEIGDLRLALSKEVDDLRSEFSDLKAALKQQIAALNAAQQAGASSSSNNNNTAEHGLQPQVAA